MTEMTYIKLLNKTLKYYFKNEYKKGYEFLSEHMDQVDGNQAQLYNFKYTLACKAGKTEQAMEILKEAVLRKGYWYASSYLKEDEDLDPLRDLDDFDEILQVCAKRERQAKSKAVSELKVIKPVDRNLKDYPLFITVHGNQENMRIVNKYFKKVLDFGYLHAVVQSSQIEFYDAYTWPDIDLGAKEIRDHYHSIKDKYEIDTDQIIMGGFSAGAEVILKAIEQKYVKPNGVILMAPWLPNIAQSNALFNQLKENDIKVYLLCGKEDQDCLPGTQKLVKGLKSKKIEYKFVLIDGLDHDYPDDFNQYLKKAVEYIME